MNNIELFKQNAPQLLDALYKKEALTADLEMDGLLVQAGKNANEIVIPKLAMDGLADYNRNSGYVNGDTNLTNETVKFNYERGRKLHTDAIDNEETGGVIAAKLTSEFLRVKVIPEIDAVRFAQYASTPDISIIPANLATGEEVYKALATAYDKMTNDEVPEDMRYLYITSTLLGLVRDLDTTKSKEILNKFAKIKTVPQNRFYTAIELNDGISDGEKIGGYKKATTGLDINFEIVHKPAVLQYTKHAKMKIFIPDEDQDGDDYKFLYRVYGLNDVYENKTAGIAVSHKIQA